MFVSIPQIKYGMSVIERLFFKIINHFKTLKNLSISYSCVSKSTPSLGKSFIDLAPPFWLRTHKGIMKRCCSECKHIKICLLTLSLNLLKAARKTGVILRVVYSY